MADNDVQLDLKKRARRRLVGAVALALVAAIVLPVVMDREPNKASGNELQIRIPGQEGSNTISRAITGVAPPPSSPTMPAAQSIPVPSPVAQSIPSAGASAPRGIVQQSAPADKPAGQSGVAASRSVAASSKSARSSRPAETDAQRARDILEDRPEARDVSPNQKLYVQLGAFHDEANAREVLNRAGSAGVKATATKGEDKTIRLRAGPYTDRATADAVVTKLKKAGVSGIVVAK